MIRSEIIKKLRPEIKKASTSEQTSTEEYVQNTVLRPVIKLQHELITEMVFASISKTNAAYKELSKEKLTGFLDSIFTKDKNLRNQLIGVIIAFFTLEELQTYRTIEKECNKRMLQICKERILSNL
ncbi:glyoxalase [Flavicella sediminum]|uniref:glyoxalase n=1 Tax=Flavicella sediminum TaxID=2585141 RepID=UPI001120BEF3|nr:glyoxalase [Flavicella sediminum]